MYERFAGFLICPQCQEKLSIEAYDREGAWIIDGLLECIKGEHFYPIIKGVPRLLLPENLFKVVDNDDLRDYLRARKAVITKKYLQVLESLNHSCLSMQDQTANYYSFMWSNYNTCYDNNDKKELDRLTGGLLDCSRYKGKSVIDVGAGAGRFVYPFLEAGARVVVCLDYGEAISLASSKHRNDSRVLCVQGDIYQPPFRDEFDMAICIGVLQHLARPEAALGRMLDLVRSEGRLFIWCYGNSSIKGLLILLRKMLNRLPMRLLWAFSAIPAFMRYMISVGSLYFEKSGLKFLSRILPFQSYAGYSFLYFRTNTFDHLSAQIINFFKEEEILFWLGNLKKRSSFCYKLTEQFRGRANASWVIDIEKDPETNMVKVQI